jgi:hypothetical protein
MAAESERRRIFRYRHGNLSVRVRKTGLAGRLQGKKTVDWMDFNHRGMAFESSQKYSLAARLLLHLSIDDSKTVEIPGILSEVRNIANRSGRYRYGVQFDLQDTPEMGADEIERSLIEIETQLKAIFRRLEAGTA